MRTIMKLITKWTNGHWDKCFYWVDNRWKQYDFVACGNVLTYIKPNDVGLCALPTWARLDIGFCQEVRDELREYWVTVL